MFGYDYPEFLLFPESVLPWASALIRVIFERLARDVIEKSGSTVNLLCTTNFKDITEN